MKNKIPIFESYRCVEGEGYNIGKPVTMIRCAGCNLRCAGCDTTYSFKITNKMYKTVGEIIKLIKSYSCFNVSLTGGEILLYPEAVEELITKLSSKNYNISLQTNGTIVTDTALSIFRRVNCVDADIKTPCTGQISDLSIIKYLREKDYVKLLIRDEVDMEYARMVNTIVKDYYCGIVLQPYNETILSTDPWTKCLKCGGNPDADNLLDKLKWIMEQVENDYQSKKYKWSSKLRILPQLHILLFGNKRKV